LGRVVLVAACWVGLALAVQPVDARAEDKVQVAVIVIHTSNQGNVVDPPTLATMKQEFAKKGLQFSSYKQLSSQTVDLAAKKLVEITLPNKEKATLTLKEIKDGTAFVDLATGGTRTVIKLGREGSLYQNAGDYQGGQLWLMLSSVTKK
jgi:hypothetical protein